MLSPFLKRAEGSQEIPEPFSDKSHQRATALSYSVLHTGAESPYYSAIFETAVVVADAIAASMEELGVVQMPDELKKRTKKKKLKN